MDIAFNYTAKTSRGQVLTGIVYAKNKALGFSKLKRTGFAPLKVTPNYVATLSNLIKGDFNQVELARFYNTVGRRMANGKPMVEGLEAASEYINDQKLRQAVMVMKEAILEGQNEFQAMTAAGFPKRDAMVVRSTVDAGKTSSSFQALGKEITRVEALRKSVAAIFRMPKLMAGMMALFVWAAITFIAPMTLSFLKQTNLRMNFNPMIAAYFDLVRLWEKAPVMYSVGYFGAIAGVVWALKSDWFKGLVDKIKLLKTISVKADQASLWNSFSLLYEAAVPAKEASRIVSDAAGRSDSRTAFSKLGRLVESGRSLEESVAVAGFPQFIISGVRSAASGGEMATGLYDMVTNLEEDVNTLTEILKENVKLGATLMMGMGVCIVFTLTYYPMLASVLSNM